jgi:hypothetical protein
MRTLAVIVSLLVLTGCEEGVATPEVTTADSGPPAGELVFDGYVTPMNATELRAPQNTFRLAGWNSSSSWIKLIHLGEDGAKVSQGDVVARFEFRGERAKPRVDREIRQAEAGRDKSGHEKKRRVDELSAEERKKQIEANRAELDTRLRGVIAERDWELARIGHRQATFEAKASGRHREAFRRELRAEKAYHERNVERAHALQKRFDMYKKRFVVEAPHDGVFRHAFSSRHGRKVQKGDGMPSGLHFASVARDDSVAVQFFVPERHWATIRDAERFVVEAASSNREWPATVERIEEFPQELGFLKKDDKLPAAREKAYVVWAQFDEKPEGLSAGVEVRVTRR